MRVFLGRLFPLLFVIVGIVLAPGQTMAGGKSVVRGWLSDESCAGGRASSGTYSSTNPDCAKKCVHQGKKIVLVDPEHKRLLTIANQDAARSQGWLGRTGPVAAHWFDETAWKGTRHVRQPRRNP